jgi:predicted DNA-binding protein
MDLQPIQIGLTTDQKGRVDRWAKRLAMSRAELVRTAVECYLSDMEADDA